MFQTCAGNYHALLRSLDRPVATLNVIVVFLDGLSGNFPRVLIVVEDIRHHFGRHAHGTPVVDPQLGTDTRHQQQRNGHTKAVTKVGVPQTSLPKCLTALFDPLAVVNIAGIELLEQELVPRVTALVHASGRTRWSLRVRLRFSLPLRSRLMLRLLLSQGATGGQQPEHRSGE